MRLKRVRIFGFKTFADRTEVNLDGGIVAVVGPNGCGKSNLVDAILWALGESNSRHLRAAASQDVIFSGSARRKPVGFAEVSLLFDNEDGSLPIDTPEVSVTRRLNRAGESDYLINQRGCRQRDVHELLADSGLGRTGYAIVGQKEIDQAVAASPEDRRAWVDEAAGVQRYRTRKVESIRRLASAREHLTRVDDILVELNAQREPLREEAEIATRYKSATAALREIETGLLIQEVAKASRELTELEGRLSASSAVARRESERVESLDRQTEELREAISTVEHRMDGIRVRLQDAITAIERSDAGAELGEERLRSLDVLEATLRSGDTEQIVMQAESELEAGRIEEAAEEELLNRCRQEVGGVGEEARKLAEGLRNAETELSAARIAHAARGKRQVERELRSERRDMASRELQGIDQDLPSLGTARDEANLAVEAAAAIVVAHEALASQGELDLGSLKAKEDALGSRSRVLLAERASMEGRKRGIEATIQAHEGLSQGSRAVLEACDQGDLEGAYVPVGQAIRTGREYALAIETALGGAANDLIVANEAVAKQAIEYLKVKRLGRATFQPISLMRPVSTLPELRSLLGRPSVVGLAGDLVECDPDHRPVVDSLLGRVLVVADLEAALGMALSTGWTKIVTLEGEVIHSSGAVSGGRAGRTHYGLVQRQADLGAIERDLAALQEEHQVIDAEITTMEAARQDLAARTQKAREELGRRRNDLAEAQEFLRVLNSEYVAGEKARDKLAKEIESLAIEVPLGDEIDVEGFQASRDGLMNALASRSADANQAKERLREAEDRLQRARIRLAGVAKRLEAAKHTEAQRLARLQNLGPERERIRREIERAETDRDSLGKTRLQCETELRESQAQKDLQLQEAIRISEEAKDARANVAAIAEANLQAELGRARADARKAAAAERLLEEYGIGVEEALEREPSTTVPPDGQPLANRLRREIRAMGSVNVGAIEAFERLSVRHTELSAQRADVVEGIEQVEASMAELDKLTSDQFVETFAKVETAYSEMFLKLFGGGEGKIYLDTPGSILESGIEIEVTLPGKKRQRLELLSGGERALCAMGFLFALLQVKPSPLVVLDEVDAPLDGRNVERFGDLLEEFTDRTQFIVITHNPTTIQRSPVWLGVTMQEPGVSTLVPARLPVKVVTESETSVRQTGLTLSSAHGKA